MYRVCITVVVLFASICSRGLAGEYYTELYDGSPATFDLNGLSLTFTPDYSTNFYWASATNITALPVDASGAQTFTMQDDDIASYNIPNSQSVQFYGNSYNTIFIGSNGRVTLGGADTSYVVSLDDHFSFAGISLFWADLYPPAGGTISVETLSDRVVVTYDHVPYYYYTGYTCTAQCELFFDGRIRLSWINCYPYVYSIVGLSEGNGTPSDFADTDMSKIGFDCDKDGLPDAWELKYVGDIFSIPYFNPQDDWDYDGVDNMDEYIGGTDPTDESSVFKAHCDTSSSQMVINWNSVAGRKYSILYKNSLNDASFSTLVSGLTYPQSNYTANATSQSQRYYKVQVQLQ